MARDWRFQRRSRRNVQQTEVTVYPHDHLGAPNAGVLEWDTEESSAYEGLAGPPIPNGPIPASRVSVEAAGQSPSFVDLQRIHDVTRAAGHLSGGDITAVGTDIAVTAGSGFIRALDDDISTLYTFDWPAPSNIPIPTDTVRYVRVDYAGGSPVVTVSASEDYDYRTGFPLGFVVNEGGTLYVNNTPHSTGRVAGRLARRNAEVDGRSRANALGGLMLSETAPNQVGVSSGATWLRGIRDEFPLFDSSGTDTFDAYYRSATPGEWIKEAGQNTLPEGLWDDGDGTLGITTNNRYAVYWFYLGPSNGIILVYGRGDYNTLALAQASQPPGDRPLRLQVGGLLLGRFIQLKSTPGPTYTVALVESAFVTDFVASIVSDHGSLAGLADDDHPQYLLRTDAQVAVGPPGLDAEDAEMPYIIPGPIGATGATGSQGIQGDPGAAGAAGAIGPMGMSGEDGEPGEMGMPGPQGAAGGAGAPGAAGAAGDRGSPGMDGLDGDDFLEGVFAPMSGHGNNFHDVTFFGMRKITVGTATPSNPSVGDLWVDTN